MTSFMISVLILKERPEGAASRRMANLRHLDLRDALCAPQGEVTESPRPGQADQAKCRDRPITPANESRLGLRCRLLHRRARLLPVGEATLEMRNRFEAHLLCGLRGQ